MSNDTGIKENKMGVDKMLPLLLSMSLPACLSMFIQGFYNIVDSIFVAQIGEDALTAVSLAFPIQLIMIGIAVGTGIGMNSLISRSLGEKKNDYANSVSNHMFFLSIICFIVFAIFAIFGSNWFLSLFTNDKNVIDMGVSYLSIVTGFSLALFLEINVEKTIQATGNMIYPMIMQSIGAIVNLIFDPILIFGLFGFPKMGVAGAAISTVFGQFMALFFSLYILFFKKHAISINLKNFRPDKEIIGKIYKVGLPTAIMQTMGSFVIIIINNILIMFSSTAVAVYGIYFKIQSFVFMPAFGICQGLLPILGYNYGAGNKERIKSGLRYGMLLIGIIMLIGTLFVVLMPTQILKAFNASDDLLDIGVEAITIMSITFLLAGISMVVISVLQALGQGFKGLLITMIRQVFVIIPFAYIMSKYIGVNAVWYSYPISEVIAFLVSILMLYQLFKHLDEDEHFRIKSQE